MNEKEKLEKKASWELKHMKKAWSGNLIRWRKGITKKEQEKKLNNINSILQKRSG